MRVYIILLFLILSCASNKSIEVQYLRAPASELHCLEIIEGLFNSESNLAEKKFLKFLKSKTENLSPQEKQYLKEKLSFYTNYLKEKKILLKSLKKKKLSLNKEFIVKEIEVLEESLGRAPPAAQINSLLSGVRQTGSLSPNQRGFLNNFADFVIEDISTVKVKKIGKQTPINSSYAGRQFPMSRLPLELSNKYPTGVWFDREGFPLFSVYATRAVEIKVTGAGRFDFLRANAAAGIERVPDDMTWHHHQDGKTMLLMPRDIHDAVKHSGGVAFVTKKIKRIKGALPAGTEWAGERYPVENLPLKIRKKYPKSVRYKVNGHPDLGPYTKTSVTIQSTGKRQLDFRLANREAGFNKLPPGMTWHLKEDGVTMQLVPRELLKVIPNTTWW